MSVAPHRQGRHPFPTATISEIDYRYSRGLNPIRMRRHAAHDWSSEPTNLLITSPTGGGATHIACATGIAACQREHDVLCTRMADLPGDWLSPLRRDRVTRTCSPGCPTPTSS